MPGENKLTDLIQIPAGVSASNEAKTVAVAPKGSDTGGNAVGSKTPPALDIPGTKKETVSTTPKESDHPDFDLAPDEDADKLTASMEEYNKYRGVETKEKDKVKKEEKSLEIDLSKAKEDEDKSKEKAKEQEGKAEDDKSESDDRPDQSSAQPKSNGISGNDKQSRRDYSDFTPEEQKILKGTSNEAFRYIVPKLKENKQLKTEVEQIKGSYEELKKSVPQNQFFDDVGYVLNKDYQEADIAVKNGEWVHNFYNEQLVKVENGEKWLDLVAGPDGKVTTVEKEPSAAGKVYLYNRINNAAGVINQSRAKIDQIKGAWEANSKNFQQLWKSEEDKYFPQYKGKEEENPHIKTMLSALEEKGQGMNPLGGILAKTVAGMMELREAYLKAMEKIKKLEAGKEIASSAGPSSESLVSGSRVDRKPELNYNDIVNYRNSRNGAY